MTATLVTGATGFIGCRLAELLSAEGVAVRGAGLARNDIEKQRAEALRRSGIELQIADLKTGDHVDAMLDGVDTVIHLAAAQHEANVGAEHFRQMNVTVTRSLLGRCEASGVGRFFYASSIGVYGVHDDGVIDEGGPIKPDNHYGRSKVAAEEALAEYRGPVQVFIGRIGETYGPWDARLLKLYAAIDRKRFWLVGGSANWHQPIYVDGLAGMIVRQLDRPEAAGRPLLLTGDGAVTTEEMCHSIAESLGRELPKWRIPMWPLVLAGAGMELTMGKLGIQPPLHRRRLDFFRKSLRFSTKLRNDLLDFPPQRSFDEGARETAAWYRQHGWLPGVPKERTI